MSEAVNQVDVSPEAIEREWAAIDEKYPGLDFSEVEGVEVVDETGDQAGGGGDEPWNAGVKKPGAGDAQSAGESAGKPGPEMPGNWMEPANLNPNETIEMAAMMIQGGLVFAVETIIGVEIPDEKYSKVSERWAVVIYKYFPDGGIMAFIARYREELFAVGATIAFIGAVRTGIIEKQKLELAEEEGAQDGNAV